MNYEVAKKYINKAPGFDSEPGLGRIKTLLECLGNPHGKLKFIHIAGTNGKGSTAAFISNILMEARYKVGIFTSPHIQRFSERIKVNHNEIPESELVRIFGMIHEKIKSTLGNELNSLTEFELITAIAFQYFMEQQCNIVVLETGLGGRLDSTNVITTPEAAVITTISYDHMDVLGNTLSKIAFEKAGIIKEYCDVVLYPQSGDVLAVIEETCKLKNSRLYKVNFSDLVVQSFNISKQMFDYEPYKSLEISLIGEYQIRNAAIAIKTMDVLKEKGYEITESALRKGLAKTKWPGRMEIIKVSPIFILDGAHNAQGAEALSKSLRKLFPEKSITFIVGILSDKEYMAMIEMIIPMAKRFITVTPKSSRGLNSHDLATICKSYCIEALPSEEIKQAIQLSLVLTSGDDIICAFGSLYYLGEIREYFGIQ